MLFNCFQCGKTISSKKEVCVYCKSDLTAFAAEFAKQRKPVDLKEKYAGTFFSYLLKTKNPTN